MDMEITVKIPEDTYRQLETTAKELGQNVSEIVVDVVQQTLSPKVDPTNRVRPLINLSDAEIIALSGLQMRPDQDAKLSELLDKQQAGKLAGDEPVQLNQLMDIYKQGALRKAQAMTEAVRRGLESFLELDES